MSATLHVLGAGSILPREGYGAAGYALRETPESGVVLLDCGPGSIRALAGHGMQVADVSAVVFSHYHLDHCLDVFALAFARHNAHAGATRPLALYGPPGLSMLIKKAPGALGRWARDPDASVHEIDHGAGFQLGASSWRCVPTRHTPEAVAWRVELPGARSLVYTGDTGPSEAVTELALDVDLLLSECSFPDGEEASNHLTPVGAARLAQAARARRLVLTHFYPQTDPHEAGAVAEQVFAGPVELARDGSVHALEG